MTWIVLAVLAVFAFQLDLLRRSRARAWEDDTAAFDVLLAQFELDLVARAKRGDAPDWLRYMDDADRIHERRSDKLRVHATAALVIGIAGTMVALALHLLVNEANPQEANTQSLQVLFNAMGGALLASLLGVGNNLLISLWLLRKADDRFATALDEFKSRLQKASAAHPPQETFAEAVKSQLGNAFREAVQRFPEAFERLDENVKSLAAVIERQSDIVLSAAIQLREGADGLTGAAAGIAPAAAGLAASTDQLRALPGELRSALDATRDGWEQEMRRDRSAFIEGVTKALADQQALLERTKDAFDKWESKRREAAEAAEARRQEFMTTVEALPATFAAEVDKVSNTLGRQFGVEARNHVQDLVQAIATDNKDLRTHVDNVSRELLGSFLNSTSDVVSKTIEDVYRRVESTLLASLDEVGRGLKEALTTLPNDARSFARSLSDAGVKMEQALDGLEASANHLGKVAALTEGLEAALTAALTKATADGVAPLQRQMDGFLADLRRTHKQLGDKHAEIDGMVEGLISFIRNLVDRLAQRGDGA